jgi:tetratricopeptide (TPR) repeat protein
LGRLDEAIDACSRAIDLDANDFGAYNERALARDAKDDAIHETAAIGDVDRAIVLKPNAWSYAERCELKLELGQYASATPDCDRSLELDPTAGWTWMQRGRLALQAGDFTAAAADLQKAIDNHSPKGASMLLAQAQLGLGKYPEALKTIDTYMEETKSVSEAYLIRAQIEAKMGQTDSAISDAKQAIAASQKPSDTAAAQSFLDGLKTPP